jgi:hypothetical protein
MRSTRRVIDFLNQSSSATANVLLVLCLIHLFSASSNICFPSRPLRLISLFKVHTSLYVEKSGFFVHNNLSLYSQSVTLSPVLIWGQPRASTNPTRSKPSHLLSKLPNASVGSDIRLDFGSGFSSRNRSTRELTEQIGVALAESARTSQRVGFAGTAKSRATSRARIRREQFTSKRRSFHRCLDILEYIALGENVATLANFESMARIVVPVVVDSMENGLGLNLGGTT